VPDNAILFTGRITGLTNVQDFNPAGLGPQNGVPEPATLALLGIGLAGIGFSRRKRAN